jgi:hypothetical protein
MAIPGIAADHGILDDYAVTVDRLTRKHLQNHKRCLDPTAVTLNSLLQEGSESFRETCTPSVTERRKAEALTCAVWQLGGYTETWARMVGFFSGWDASATARVRECWSRLRGTGDPGGVLYAGVKPAALLKAHVGAKGNAETFWVTADQIVNQLTVLWQQVLPIMAHMVTVWPAIPFRELCRLASAVPFFGQGGESGLSHSGPYGLHPDRVPSFWAKELVLSLLGTGLWGPEKEDMRTFTPAGNGARRGLALLLGLTSTASEEIPRVLEGDVSAIMAAIYTRRSKYNWGHEDLILHDIQWNCCEAKKVWLPGGRLRRTARQGQAQKRKRLCHKQPPPSRPTLHVGRALRRRAAQTRTQHAEAKQRSKDKIPKALMRLARKLQRHESQKGQLQSDTLTRVFSPKDLNAGFEAARRYQGRTCEPSVDLVGRQGRRGGNRDWLLNVLRCIGQQP